MLVGNGLLRIANAGGGALVGFYLADMARHGAPVGAGLVGTLGAVASGAELVGALPMGVLVDRFAPRSVLVAGALLGAVATQLFGLTRVVPIFLLSRALEGIAAASSTSPLLAHLADASRPDRALRSRVMSFFELSLLAGMALGALVGGTLWDSVKTAAFSLMAALYLLVALLFWWGVRGYPITRSTPHPLCGLRRALSEPQLLRLAPAWLAVTAIIGMWLTQIGFQLSGPPASGQYLVGRFTPGEVGLVLLVYSLVFAAGVTAWGFLMARIARRRVLVVTMVAMLFACLWLYLLNHSGPLPLWMRGALVVLAAFTVMAESGFTPAALAYLADVADKGEGRGAAMGIYSLLLGLGGIAGAALGGWLGRAFALDGLLLGTLFLTLVALAALARLRREPGTAAPAQE